VLLSISTPLVTLDVGSVSLGTLHQLVRICLWHLRRSQLEMWINNTCYQQAHEQHNAKLRILWPFLGMPKSPMLLGCQIVFSVKLSTDYRKLPILLPKTTENYRFLQTTEKNRFYNRKAPTLQPKCSIGCLRPIVVFWSWAFALPNLHVRTLHTVLTSFYFCSHRLANQTKMSLSSRVLLITIC
jgi:hypothetical protein